MIKTLITMGMFSLSLTVLAKDFAPIRRDHNGEVINMNYFDAVEYCERLGGRLPSSRELAELFVLNGAGTGINAPGIVESKFRGNPMQSDEVFMERNHLNPNGSARYYPIPFINGEATRAIDFYFSNWGYKRPTGDLGDADFWSSGLFRYEANNFYTTTFNGVTGGVMWSLVAPSASGSTALCVVNE